MRIVAYAEEDLDEVSKLFYETVHAVNAADYSREQLSVWAESENSLKRRNADLLKMRTVVAKIDGQTVGFGSIDEKGYLDLLFVHKDFQGKGIASAICNELERGYAVVTTHSSVTAKPFFEKRGYTVVKEREVERLGVKLQNYLMIKRF